MKRKRADGPETSALAPTEVASPQTPIGVVVVGGIDPTAGAGILADVRHLQVLGARAGAAATVIVPQDLRRLRKLVHLDIGLVLEQMRAAIQVVAPQTLKISLVPSPEHASALAVEANAWRRKTGGAVVYDPVLRASVGGALSAEPGPWLGQMLAAADVATPNLTEAGEIVAALAGGPLKEKKSPSEFAAAISARMAHDGPGAVVLKSAGPATDLVLGRAGGRGSPLDELRLRGD
ncbi:MAG TPA: bifunctional hydroxymethylpyrimidine kinase/phosphomethylpyrimidine kinase, partial [Thermoplasmata archaeon]|nr:bifunctional hydroxymethylpyrimidine kinase/phosphomethylpyrimidine kinase [Thermoplasmata archaeon]